MQCDELDIPMARSLRRAVAANGKQLLNGNSRSGYHTSASQQLKALPAQEDRPEKAGAVWSRYSSIENVVSANKLLSIRAAVAAQLGPQCEWIASEKVHGANFCFETDGQQVDYASRTSRLGNNADFYNARATMPRYHPFVLEAFSIAKQRVPTLSSILIYGEYFGGYYPGHPAEPGMKKVQGGVAYSPGHHFYAFDVSLDGQDYLDFDEARDLLLAAGFPLVAAPLWRGPLDELLAIDVEALETTLPALLGHEALDRFCIAEGIVLRPLREVRIGSDRAILKKKAQAFWEATNQPSMAVQTAHAGAQASQARGAFAGLEHLLEVVRSLTTENRLRAVISKDPDLLGNGQEHKLAGLFARDVLEDFQKQHNQEWAALGKEVAALKRSVGFITRSFVVENVARIREDVG